MPTQHFFVSPFRGISRIFRAYFIFHLTILNSEPTSTFQVEMRQIITSVINYDFRDNFLGILIVDVEIVKISFSAQGPNIRKRTLYFESQTESRTVTDNIR